MTVQQTLFYHTEKIFVQKDLYSKQFCPNSFFARKIPFFASPKQEVLQRRWKRACLTIQVEFRLSLLTPFDHSHYHHASLPTSRSCQQPPPRDEVQACPSQDHTGSGDHHHLAKDVSSQGETRCPIQSKR
jgi:hypothetical protein